MGKNIHELYLTLNEKTIRGEKLFSANCPSNIAGFMFRQGHHLSDRECLHILYLNNKAEAFATETSSIGSINSSMISIREILKTALYCNASYIVAVHNHPSSNVEPSTDDIVATKKLKEAGDLLGVKLLDSIIIGPKENYYSFSKEGLIEG